MTSWCNRVGVPHDAGVLVLHSQPHRHAGGCGPGQQVAHLSQDSGRRQRSVASRRPARYGQDLLHQRLTTTSRVEYCRDRLTQPRIVPGTLGSDLAKAQDRTQNIVEVVGNAPGHRAQGLQLLRLAQLGIQQGPLAHQCTHQQRRRSNHGEVLLQMQHRLSARCQRRGEGAITVGRVPQGDQRGNRHRAGRAANLEAQRRPHQKWGDKVRQGHDRSGRTRHRAECDLRGDRRAHGDSRGLQDTQRGNDGPVARARGGPGEDQRRHQYDAESLRDPPHPPLGNEIPTVEEIRNGSAQRGGKGVRAHRRNEREDENATNAGKLQRPSRQAQQQPRRAARHQHIGNGKQRRHQPTVATGKRVECIGGEHRAEDVGPVPARGEQQRGKRDAPGRPDVGYAAGIGGQLHAQPGQREIAQP